MPLPALEFAVILLEGLFAIIEFFKVNFPPEERLNFFLSPFTLFSITKILLFLNYSSTLSSVNQCCLAFIITEPASSSFIKTLLPKIPKSSPLSNSASSSNVLILFSANVKISDLLSSENSYKSFFSGHTSTAFAIGTSTAKMLTNYSDIDKKLVWISALGLASSTGYFRIAADKHYFSDVFVGAIVGSLIGNTMFDKKHRLHPSRCNERKKLLNLQYGHSMFQESQGNRCADQKLPFDCTYCNVYNIDRTLIKNTTC